MKSAVLLAAFAATFLVAGAARADQAMEPRILPRPAGWVLDDAHAQLVKSSMERELPAGMLGSVEVYSYHPSERGGQLIASLVTVNVVGEAGGAWVRERIDAIQETPSLMAGDTGKVRTISWAEKSDAAAKLVEANLQWANDDDQTVSIVRAVWVRRVHPEGTPDVIEEYRGECVMSADAVATLQPPCVEALGQMMLPPESNRLAIAPPAKVADPEAEGDDEPAVPVAPATPATPDTKESPEGAEIHKTPDSVAPIVVNNPAPSAGRDLRPFWIAGGLLIVVALLLWNRKKRQELIAEEERRAKETAKVKPDPEPEPAAADAPDADANDLADAADKDDA
jgi:hypothetical protein